MTSVKPLRKPTHGLAAIPDRSYADSYINRTVVPGKTEFDVFDYARAERMNVLIEGPTGPGKTSAVLAYASSRKRPFYAIPSNVGIEPSQLFGKFIPDGNGGFEWIDGPVTDLVRHGGVLLINEVNFMPDRIATVLFGLLDLRRQIVLLDHRGEMITAHDDLLIVADMNPDYEGTRPLNAAFRNRFPVQLFFDYDDKIEEILVPNVSLRAMVRQIREEAATNATYSVPASTNMMIEFLRFADGLGLDFAIHVFSNHFPAEERGPVKVVCETWKQNIADDLRRASTAGDDELSSNSDDSELWRLREEAADGWVDPEWGIKGIDWVFQD